MSNTRVSVRLIYQQLMMTVKNPTHFSGGSMSNDDYNCLREVQRNSKCIPISVCTGNWQGKIERIIRRKGIH